MKRCVLHTHASARLILLLLPVRGTKKTKQENLSSWLMVAAPDTSQTDRPVAAWGPSLVDRQMERPGTGTGTDTDTDTDTECPSVLMHLGPASNVLQGRGICPTREGLLRHLWVGFTVQHCTIGSRLLSRLPSWLLSRLHGRIAYAPRPRRKIRPCGAATNTSRCVP